MQLCAILSESKSKAHSEKYIHTRQYLPAMIFHSFLLKIHSFFIVPRISITVFYLTGFNPENNKSKLRLEADLEPKIVHICSTVLWIIASAYTDAVWGRKVAQDYIQPLFYSARVPDFIRPPGSIEQNRFCPWKVDIRTTLRDAIFRQRGDKKEEKKIAISIRGLVEFKEIFVVDSMKGSWKLFCRGRWSTTGP
jgi:hypothetical protein